MTESVLNNLKLIAEQGRQQGINMQWTEQLIAHLSNKPTLLTEVPPTSPMEVEQYAKQMTSMLQNSIDQRMLLKG